MNIRIDNPTHEVTFRVCRLHTLKDADLEAWRNILLADGDLRRAFMSPSYANAVNAVDRPVYVVVGWCKSLPVLFLPLQRQLGVLGLLGVFEPVGGVMTDYFGVVAREGIRLDAHMDVCKGLIKAISYSHLDETQVKFGLTGSQSRIGLRTRLGTPPSEYWTRLRISNKKVVSDTERRANKLANEVGDLVFEWSSANASEDLQWLIETKKKQYTRTGKTIAPLFDNANVALLKQLLHTTDDTCRGTLSVLRCNGSIIAAHFGLQCCEVLHVWFPVYDQNYSHCSPGRILFRFMFEEGAVHGIEVFDRGEGDNAAKRDFANEEHRFLRGAWFAKSFFGQLARIGLAIAWRLALIKEHSAAKKTLMASLLKQ